VECERRERERKTERGCTATIDPIRLVGTCMNSFPGHPLQPLGIQCKKNGGQVTTEIKRLQETLRTTAPVVEMWWFYRVVAGMNRVAKS
jgi:hypothetical protein